MTTRLIAAAAMACLLTVSGCASGGASGASRNMMVLTRAEIDSINVSTLYEVVQRLRPRWLDVRGSRSLGLGTGVVVYQGRTLLGGPEVLEQLGRESAESLRYMDGTTAKNSLPGIGTQHVEAAIIIETRRH